MSKKLNLEIRKKLEKNETKWGLNLGLKYQRGETKLLSHYTFMSVLGI
jgi:hypothetical protein